MDNGAPYEGDTVTYTVTVKNNGPDPASSVQISDALPPGVTYVSGGASAGSYDPGADAWNVGPLSVGASASLSVTAAVNDGTAGDTLINTASRTASTPADPNSSNDSASASIFVQAMPSADLMVGKSVDNAAPNEGDTVTFTVSVTNQGPDSVTSIAVGDKLPAGLTYTGHGASMGTYDPGDGTWQVGTLNLNGSATLTITATVDGGTSGQKITNVASITSASQADPDLSNNTASAAITVQ